MRFKPPYFLRKLMPLLVWDIPGAGGHCEGANHFDSVYLTFDDGPTPGITEWILEELDRYDAKATFFCLGKNVELHPDLYRRIVESGHKVGNHSYSHAKGWERTPKSYARNVERAAQFIHSDLFRPPYGRISRRQARLLGLHYKIVMWNIISRDYAWQVSPQKCLDNVIHHVRPDDIVVFHDSKKAFRNLKFALPETLKFLQQHGMRSKSIELS
jgi:peptidoglycan/xylan/chitin deacetylase (PgdA/CDA1 family)